MEMVLPIETLALGFLSATVVGLAASQLTERVSTVQALLIALSATLGIAIGAAFG